MSPTEAAGTHRFTLVDANDGSHEYIVQEHPAGDGMEIMYELLGLGAPAVVGIIEVGLKSAELARTALRALLDGSVPATAGGLLKAIGDADLDDLLGMLKDLDLERVGAELGKALGTGKAPLLTRKIIAYTHRDGHALKEPVHFGQAFRGNYAELLQLVWKVCSINRFFPASFTSPSSPSAKGSPTS